MQLTKLLSAIKTRRVEGSTDREITSICIDSRRVKPGALFVAMKGEKTSGAEYIAAAEAAGAVAYVCETPQMMARATQIVVEDSRLALADLAAAFYENPGNKLKVTGVTGTNGKTTSVFLIKHICDKAMQLCGLIGTVRYEVGERILPAPRTTPESVDIQDLLWQMRAAGCRAATMEVSSHALCQARVRGLEFDAAVFTNLTTDHLDYHKTMDAYFDAKVSLFENMAKQKRKKGVAVINLDDRYGQLLVNRLRGASLKILTFGQGALTDLRASNIRTDFNGSSYQLDAEGRSYLVRLPLIGNFNVHNSLGAIGAAFAIGVPIREAVLALATAPAVPGRLQPVPGKRNFRVFVDYAHTDDALLNVLKTCRDLQPHRIIVVFGCGGNRDRTKRPRMGAVVDAHADVAIITSDNPRREDPMTIIEDIKPGMRSGRYEVVVDRQAAIRRAIELAEPRDIVLICGKGHEQTQEFADHTIPFDDVSVAESAMVDKRTERPD